jgi:hypothetical protein
MVNWTPIFGHMIFVIYVAVIYGLIYWLFGTKRVLDQEEQADKNCKIEANRTIRQNQIEEVSKWN